MTQIDLKFKDFVRQQSVYSFQTVSLPADVENSSEQPVVHGENWKKMPTRLVDISIATIDKLSDIFLVIVTCQDQ